MKDFDLAAASLAAQEGKLEVWVHEYLRGPGRNPEFSHGLHLERRCWHGPLEVPLASLRRCCGPEPEMPFREPYADWVKAVSRLARSSTPQQAFPPLLVRYEQGQLVVTDGNHRHAAFLLRGFATCWAVIWYPNQSEFEHHEARRFRVCAV
jgi:hypothetical protein